MKTGLFLDYIINIHVILKHETFYDAEAVHTKLLVCCALITQQRTLAIRRRSSY